jgi:hypothetical protein
MSQFILTLDLTDHTHDHSPMAQRHIVGHLLDHAKHAIGSGLAKEGELVYPPGSHRVIGSWKFLNEATAEQPTP